MFLWEERKGREGLLCSPRRPKQRNQRLPYKSRHYNEHRETCLAYQLLLNWNVAFFIHRFSYTKESLGSPNKYHKHSIKITLAKACFCHTGFLHIFRFVVVSDNGACTCPRIIWCMHLDTKRLCHLK